MKTKQQGSALILSIAILLAGTLLGKYFLTANQHYHDVFTYSLVDAKLQLQLDSYAQWAHVMMRRGNSCLEIMHDYTKLGLDNGLGATTTIECSNQTTDPQSLVGNGLEINSEVGVFGSETYHYKSVKLNVY